MRTITLLKIVGIALMISLFVGSDVAAMQVRGVEITLQAEAMLGGAATAEQMTLARTIVENRLADAGVSGYNVEIAQDNLLVQLPGVNDPAAVTALVQQTGLLEFIDAGDTPLEVGSTVFTDSEVNAGKPAGKVYHVIITRADLDASEISFVVDQIGEPVVNFKLNVTGAKKLADFTAANVGHYMAVLLDKRVIISPKIQAKISDGVGVLNGLRDADEAKRIAVLLKSGALPVRLTVTESKVVDNLVAPTVTPATSPTPTIVAPAMQGELNLSLLLIVAAVVLVFIVAVTLLTTRRRKIV